MKTKFFSLLSLLLVACTPHVEDTIEPKMECALHEKTLQTLPSAFAPISLVEAKKDWALEYKMGLYFAKKLDLYRAITAFNRAEFLLSEDLEFSHHLHRKHEVQYLTLLCYSIGKRYDELLHFFENSSLMFIDSTFPVYHDLLVILKEAYEKKENLLKMKAIDKLLTLNYPKTAYHLSIGKALVDGDIPMLTTLLEEPTIAKAPTPQSNEIHLINQTDSPFKHHFINLTSFDLKRVEDENHSIEEKIHLYQKTKKSVLAAEVLNALLPGAGYFYVGQKQSAFTAFAINSLFIGTAAYFFKEKNIPAALLTLSFESGWYFGGILGAGEAAKTYNERLYEHHANPVMEEQRLFPILQLQYGF